MGDTMTLQTATFTPTTTNGIHPGYAGQRVTVLRELGDEDRDREVGPMYSIRFSDGAMTDAFGDELTDWNTANLPILTADDL